LRASHFVHKQKAGSPTHIGTILVPHARGTPKQKELERLVARACTKRRASTAGGPPERPSGLLAEEDRRQWVQGGVYAVAPPWFFFKELPHMGIVKVPRAREAPIRAGANKVTRGSCWLAKPGGPYSSLERARRTTEGTCFPLHGLSRGYYGPRSAVEQKAGEQKQPLCL
jgi:hypothetical protein